MHAVCLALAAFLLGGLVEVHDWFDGLQAPNGQRCCGQDDCRAVPYRRNTTTGQEEVQVNGAWWPVDPAKILTQSAPDGQVYACLALRWPLPWARRPDRPPHLAHPIPAFRCFFLPRMG
jgi:hypothetical protein